MPLLARQQRLDNPSIPRGMCGDHLSRERANGFIALDIKAILGIRQPRLRQRL
jgi:hypothetical protein